MTATTMSTSPTEADATAITVEQQQQTSFIARTTEQFEVLQTQALGLIPSEVREFSKTKFPALTAGWENVNGRPLGQLAIVTIGLKLTLLSFGLIVTLWPAISVIGNALFFVAIAFTLFKLALAAFDSSKIVALPFLLSSQESDRTATAAADTQSIEEPPSPTKINKPRRSSTASAS